jgi:hypothetical protein
VCSRSNLHLLSNQGQRLLCAETARRAKCDGEAGERILGLTGNAIDGNLKAQCLTVVTLMLSIVTKMAIKAEDSVANYI